MLYLEAQINLVTNLSIDCADFITVVVWDLQEIIKQESSRQTQIVYYILYMFRPYGVIIRPSL